MSTKTKGGLPKNLGEGTRNLFVGDPLDGVVKAEAIHLKGLPQTSDADVGYGNLAHVLNDLKGSSGFCKISDFGVVSGNELDQSAKIQECINYAAPKKINYNV